MKFKDLSSMAVKGAMEEYKIGWFESHPDDEEPTWDELYELCMDDDSTEYDMFGSILEDE